MRIAVISDVHSNLHALDAVLADAGTVDAIWHLGDVVGYGPEPDGVVDRLASRGAVGVRGNHDLAACGGDEIEWFNADARKAMEWTRKVAAPATIAWLGAQPERREEGAFTLVHGSPLDPTWEYVTTIEAARDNLLATTTTHALHGHTHLPMAYSLTGNRASRVAASGPPGVPLEARMLINPGSVGQPRDGDPRASYLLMDLSANQLTWHRVPYDIAAVQSRMQAVGLPIRLRERLSHGY